VAIAVAVAAGITVFRHDFKVFLSVVMLALWTSLGGHYVEVAFANYLSARIPQAHWFQVGVRLLVWFVGGGLLYVFMIVTARILPIKPLPPQLWWCGGLAFIVLELVLHAILAHRGNSDFYRVRR
jgi:hypothetical protein